jgi:hypothetical protein
MTGAVVHCEVEGDIKGGIEGDRRRSSGFKFKRKSNIFIFSFRNSMN